MADLDSIEIKDFDTIVVGSGLAGLTAAYHASRNGSVAIITKSQLDISNSYYAQGGIAVVTEKDDSFESHIQDTLEAGRGLCDLDAVKILVEEGQDCVYELIRLGMQFDHGRREIFPWTRRRTQPSQDSSCRRRCNRKRTHQLHAKKGKGAEKYYPF